MSDPKIYPSPLTERQRMDWHDTSPDTPRANAARENTRDLLLEACALERELAEAKAALEQVRAIITGTIRRGDIGRAQAIIDAALSENPAQPRSADN